MTETTKPMVPIGDYPIGTVLPFAGIDLDGALARAGWWACDGRARSRSEYAELYAVIGDLHGGGDKTSTFNLPDYRGWFQRGVDQGTGRDPDARQRTEAMPGGKTGDHCGTAQASGTALPVGPPFGVTEDGAHSHVVTNLPDQHSFYPDGGDAWAEWNPGEGQTTEAGEHRHTVMGGDPESRPVNAYVDFIIRYRA